MTILLTSDNTDTLSGVMRDFVACLDLFWGVRWRYTECVPPAEFQVVVRDTVHGVRRCRQTCHCSSVLPTATRVGSRGLWGPPTAALQTGCARRRGRAFGFAAV